MIKVNLIPLKRKKKAKPIPAFIIVGVIVTLVVGIVMAYLIFFFNSRLAAKKVQYTANEKMISELKEKIKAVENFEQLNRTIQQRNEIIEQLSKNKSVPVKVLDEVSNLIPKGIWLESMTILGANISLNGYGFTNPDIVEFVDNVKNSKMFAEVYLQESVSTELEKIPVYKFRLTFTIKA
jgi:type IV pilus assembly protein PilN